MSKVVNISIIVNGKLQFTIKFIDSVIWICLTDGACLTNCLVYLVNSYDMIYMVAFGNIYSAKLHFLPGSELYDCKESSVIS